MFDRTKVRVNHPSGANVVKFSKNSVIKKKINDVTSVEPQFIWGVEVQIRAPMGAYG